MALFNDGLPPDSDSVKNGASIIRFLKAALDSIFTVFLNDDGTFKLNVIPGGALTNHSVTTLQLDTTTIPTLLQVPTGTVTMFAAGPGSAPTNWLYCDGSPVSRTTYSALFAVIGSTYGPGDGSTTFNVPDFRGRAPVGPDQSQGRTPTINALAAHAGEATHTLLASEAPPHQHFVANGDTAPLDQNLNASRILALNGPRSASGANYILSGTATPATIGLTSDGSSALLGGAHNNVQPSLGINFIIRI